MCYTGLLPVVLLLYWAGLPPAVLGPSVLSKGVETGPTTTQLGLACVQTMSPKSKERRCKVGLSSVSATK